MRILFMGTPDFAEASLRRLYEDRHTIVGVFTQPDKPKNRGMKPAFSPVKQLALKNNTPLFQPASLRDGAAAEILKELDPELIVVVAYGKLLPDDVLRYPKYGCINIHGSILPKYRGAAPIQWAVLNGERVTGVTAMYLSHEMDAGDIIAVKETEIGPDETSGMLFDRLMLLGSQLLSETVDAIEAGTAQRAPQDHSQATFAPMITKSLCPIDWSKTGAEIKNQVRGLLPWPVATAEIAGNIFKVYRVAFDAKPVSAMSGTLLSAGNDGIIFACGDGTVTIQELQAAGGRRMSASDYLRGHPICL